MSTVGRRVPRGGAAGPGSPLSLLPGGIGAVLSVVGLVVVAVVTVGLLGGKLPTLPGGGGDNGGPIRTPTPSGVVITDPRADVPGSLLYVKAGNIWIQSGEKAHLLTTTGDDAMPTWSADGQWVYFVRYAAVRGHWPVNGAIAPYDLQIPTLERIHPDGTGEESLLSGRFVRGSDLWSYFLRQPSISPGGTTAAVVTDGPDPTRSDLVLKFVNLSSRKISDPNLADIGGLGHQDPAWSPDGRIVLYVQNVRDGTRGAPVILKYDTTTRKTTALTGAGYIAPAWSPDGRYVAATKTDSFGTDIVILDARTGAELLRLTNDSNSFDPTWSPAGDAIAFFRVDHGVVDLELTALKGSAPQWTVGETLALTIAAGLDAGSRPDWYIPPDQLPATPVPTLAPTPIPTQPAPS